jgi:hypothetical protein
MMAMDLLEVKRYKRIVMGCLVTLNEDKQGFTHSLSRGVATVLLCGRLDIHRFHGSWYSELKPIYLYSRVSEKGSSRKSKGTK